MTEQEGPSTALMDRPMKSEPMWRLRNLVLSAVMLVLSIVGVWVTVLALFSDDTTGL